MPDEFEQSGFDNIIDIDRLYSQEFSDYLKKESIGNPVLKGNKTLILAASLLIHDTYTQRPHIALTVCNRDGLVLLETTNKAKIGKVCYLAMCKKLVFISKLREGNPVTMKLLGERLLSASDSDSAYITAYPLFNRSREFIGYITGSICEQRYLEECRETVSFLAKMVDDYNTLLEKQAEIRGRIMNNIHGYALIVQANGQIEEGNEAICKFLREHGMHIDGLNLFDLLVDKERLRDRLSGGGKQAADLIIEFKMRLPSGLFACEIFQCEPLPSLYREDCYLLCFEMHRFLDTGGEKGTASPSIKDQFAGLMSKHPQFNEILEICSIVAAKKINILIQGESGTGKEVLSRAIHQVSLFPGPFVAMNCGAIAPNLLLSELFGYEEGAFTGASKGGKMGKLEFANNGTLFLDEIGEMPLESQVSLLKFLDEQIVVRVGDTKQRAVSVRIIAATNRNLAEEVKAGNFREDLFYRLNVVDFQLPPLRERKEDIPLIAQNILASLARQHRVPLIALDKSCPWLLKQYDWPGNIRELKNILELASALTSEEIIALPLLQRIMEKKCFTTGEATAAAAPCEAERIQMVLDRNNWKITTAAVELKMSRTTLYKKISQFDLKETRAIS